MQTSNYKTHRLYEEFFNLRYDDDTFSAMYDDTEEDFLAWAMEYETDADWREMPDCPKCGGKLSNENVSEGYVYSCPACDEDFGLLGGKNDF